MVDGKFHLGGKDEGRRPGLPQPNCRVCVTAWEGYLHACEDAFLDGRQRELNETRPVWRCCVDHQPVPIRVRALIVFDTGSSASLSLD